MRTMSPSSLKIIELSTASSPCFYVMKGSGCNLQVVEAFLTRKDAEAFVVNHRPSSRHLNETVVKSGNYRIQ